MMALTIMEKFWPLSPTVGEEVEIMTVDWAAAAKFLLSENSDKTPLTELAKNQAFPLFMAACG